MTREKRGLESTEGGDQLREPKRPKAPALASVIVEALKVDSLQRLCSSLEPILRRVVSEEVERALAKLGPARLTGSTGRASPKRIEGPDGRNLQLHFKSRLSLPLFTGGKVEGEQGAAIHVVLLDASTGLVVTSGPESSVKLDVVVLEGDFNNEDDENWTEEEFESHVVKEREGKRPLLTGELQVTLREGVGTIGELTFTDNSSWIRSRKFRLGLRISSGFCEGIRIREAKTEAFIVKDHRGELYKKHYPPSWKDEVWRLEKIGKDGSFHKKLNKSGIHSVEDFLRLYVRDPQKLRSILGSGMSNKMWDSLIEHAKTCPLSGTHYVFYADDTRGIGAIFNQIFEFAGLIANSQFYSAESLADNQKVYADTLVKKAYDNWHQVVEYDGKVLLGLKTNEKTVTTRSDPPDSMRNNSSSYDHASSQHISVPFQQPLIDTALANRGVAGSSSYNSNQLSAYSRSAPQVASTSQVQYENTSFASAEQFNVSNPTGSSLNSMDLALGQQSNLMLQPLGQSMDAGNINSFFDWPRQRENQVADEYLTEDEIRFRSHEILENDEMQQLLRHLSYAGASNNLTDDTYGYQSFMQSPALNFNFEDDQSRSSGGKAVVGWLKIKAAMRWGIFIRKQAAERRKAQLVELDD